MKRMTIILAATSVSLFLAGAAYAFEADLASVPDYGIGRVSAASPFVVAEVSSNLAGAVGNATATDGSHTFAVTSLGYAAANNPTGSVELFSIDVSSACPGTFILKFTAEYSVGNPILTSTASRYVNCN